jgi:hypothetical protein
MSENVGLAVSGGLISSVQHASHVFYGVQESVKKTDLSGELSCNFFEQEQEQQQQYLATS